MRLNGLFFKMIGWPHCQITLANSKRLLYIPEVVVVINNSFVGFLSQIRIVSFYPKKSLTKILVSSLLSAISPNTFFAGRE